MLLLLFTNSISLDDFGLAVFGHIDEGLTTNRNISEVCAKACALNSGSVLSVRPEMPVMTCIEHMQFYISWGLQGCKRLLDSHRYKACMYTQLYSTRSSATETHFAYFPCSRPHARSACLLRHCYLSELCDNCCVRRRKSTMVKVPVSFPFTKPSSTAAIGRYKQLQKSPNTSTYVRSSG